MSVVKLLLAGILPVALMCGCSTTARWTEETAGPDKTVKGDSLIISSNSSYHFDGQPSVAGENLHLRVVEKTERTIQDRKVVLHSQLVTHYECKERPRLPLLGSVIIYPTTSAMCVGIPLVVDLFVACKYAVQSDPKKREEIYRGSVFWWCLNDWSHSGKRDLSTQRTVHTETIWEQPGENISEGPPQTVRNSAPGVHIEVTLVPTNMLISGKPLQTVVKTDDRGYLTVPVSYPSGIFGTREEAQANVIASLSSDYFLDKLDSVLKDLELVQKERGLIACAVGDEKASVDVPLFRPRDVRDRIDQYIRALLEKHLSDVYAPSEIQIDARDIDSLAMLDDVRLELSSLSVLKEDDIRKEALQFLSQYVKKEKGYDRCMVNPGQFIFSLPGNVDVSRTYRRKINVPSSYRVLVTHPGYFFVKGELTFSQNALHKVVHMSKLRGKIDVKESEGQMDHGKIEDK